MYSLAEVVVVSSSLTLLEQDLETLGHVDAEVLVEVSDEGGDPGEDDCLGDPVGGEVLAAEGGDLHVVLDHERSVQTLEGGKER